MHWEKRRMIVIEEEGREFGKPVTIKFIPSSLTLKPLGVF
jgi:hypothetical protein